MSDVKSVDIKKAGEAIELLDAIDGVEGVRAFIEGETRPSVLAAAEKRIAEIAPPEQEPEHEPAVEEGARIAAQDTWMYHNDEEPRIFKAGEEIPGGWQESPKGIVPDIWEHDAYGKWSRKA